MNNIADVFRGREWTQSILVIFLMVAIIYMAIQGQEIPSILEVAFGTALGFFFGAKINGNNFSG
ncbi:hypothetical protein LCGC14_3031970 [marine sediment metagenome]|uniref:Uncharacterized protein n=1 Tax=marine sediment metagenome TaxID=412755 RepID=A0A0F8XFB5_9ZZZZ